MERRCWQGARAKKTRGKLPDPVDGGRSTPGICTCGALGEFGLGRSLLSVGPMLKTTLLLGHRPSARTTFLLGQRE